MYLTVACTEHCTTFSSEIALYVARFCPYFFAASRLSAVLFSLHVLSAVAGGSPAGVDKYGANFTHINIYSVDDLCCLQKRDVFGSQHALRVRRDGEEVLHADVADSDDSR